MYLRSWATPLESMLLYISATPPSHLFEDDWGLLRGDYSVVIAFNPIEEEPFFFFSEVSSDRFSSLLYHSW